MGGAKKQYEELQEKGLSNVPDTLVCASHINDRAIQAFIRKNGLPGQCSYCQKARTTIELEDLMTFIMQAVRHFFQDPADFASIDRGEYLVKLWEIEDVFNDLGLDRIIENDHLAAHIFSSPNPFAGYAKEYGSLKDIKSESWGTFVHSIKHHSRFLFSLDTTHTFNKTKSPHDFLRDLASTIKRLKLFRNLEIETQLYRCRQHVGLNDVTSLRDICSTPIQLATTTNRMSAAGISMLYAAFDPDTALSETLDLKDRKKPKYTMARLLTKRSIKVLDFTKLPSFSPFDQKNWQNFDTVSFLHEFVKDISQPITRDGREHVEYVPTQIITEYFRFHFQKSEPKIEGIIYPSSKVPHRNAVVLFWDHHKSYNELILPQRCLTTKNIKFPARPRKKISP